MAKVPVLVQAWTKCNNMVVSWILNCVSPKILASVVYKNTALEIWNDLKNRFSQKNGLILFQLQKELATIYQGDLFITNHFTQLNVMWDEIENYRALPCCTCGSCTCSINEKLTRFQLQDLVMQFLMGLNESYNQIRWQILLIDPLPSINKVYSLLVQDESQRAIGHSIGAYVESIALATKASGGSSYGGGNASSHVGKGIKNKGKKGLYVVIMESQVMLLRSAINFVAIPLAIRERKSIQWLFKLEVLILGSWTPILCLNNSSSHLSQLFPSL